MADHVLSDKLADPQWVADNLDNPQVRIVEVGSLLDPNSYAQGHIPGAILWPWQETLWHPEMRDFPTPEGFADLMGRSGIGGDTTIVFYSNLVQYAAYAFWICTMRGHGRIRVFNGNRNLWIKEGHSLSTEIPAVGRVEYPLRPLDESSRIGRDGILAGLGNPDRVLLDMRSAEEYRGERVSPPWFPVDHGATRKGHIPGARNIYYAALLDENERFKPLDVLREIFVKAGATPDREIVSYCRLSHRASMAWFLLTQLLGYPRAKVYDGSWTEWGSMVGMPIVNETLRRGGRADGAAPGPREGGAAQSGGAVPPGGCG